MALHGMLFVAILLDSVGLPLAAELLIAGAGAAARAGSIEPGIGFGVAVSATVAGHCAAYWMGRLVGQRLVPAAIRYRPGVVALGLSRFLVGMRVVLCPLAGLANIPFRFFLILDVAGACIWVAAFMLLGYAGGPYLDLLRAALDVGGATILVIAAGAAAALAVPPIVRRLRPADGA